MKSKLKPLQELLSGVGKTVSKVGNYFNPESNADNNFWGNAGVQNNVRRLDSVLGANATLPKVNLSKYTPQFQSQNNPNVPTWVNNTKNAFANVANLPINLVSGIAEGVINAPGRAFETGARSTNLFNDVINNKQPLTGTRLVNTVAPFATAAIDIYGLGMGKQIAKEGFKQAVKKGFLKTVGEGSLKGMAYGGGRNFFNAASNSNVVKENSLQSTIQPTLEGAGGGLILGGALSGLGAGIEIIKQLTTRTPIMEAQLIKLSKSWKVGETPIKPGGMPKKVWAFQQRFNTRYKRNPYLPVHLEDIQTAIEIESKNIPDINKPVKVGEISKQQEGQSKQTPSPVSETKIPLQGVDSSDTIISSLKSKVNRIYTDEIDRFNPFSQMAKIAGEDQKMRNALTGHYGAGSTAQYHVDFELSPILKEQKIDDLRRVAIAQRDVELAGRNIKGSNAGLNIDALKAEMGAEKFKAVQGTLDKLYKYQDEMVKKYLVRTGIISESSYNAMRAKNQFYVPFKRVMDEVDDFLGFVPQTRSAGSVSSQNVIQGIKGSERTIVDPIESILESTYKMVGLGKRQEVARTIVLLKDKLPAGMVEKVVGNAGNRPTISLFENGKVQKYLVPADVAEAAKGLSEESLNSIVKILSVPTQVFRATATGMNLEFVTPNVARDVQSAFVNVGLNPFKWVSGLAHMMKKDEVYQEFLKAGGKTSRISIDRPMLTRTVAGITSKKGFAIKKPSDLLKILQSVAEYSEQPTRIAVFENEFVKGLKNGLSKEEAAIRAAGWAQDATVNFARRGAKTQSVNAIYAFLNARAQGIDRLVRTLKNDPVGGAFRIGLITQVPALAGYAWNRQFDSYYDDRVVSATDRRTNIIIMLSDTPIPQLGGAQFVKIPKGDIGKLANPMEEFLRYADDKGGDVKKAMFDVLKGFSPWDNMGDLIPTALRPPIEATVNKSFFTGYPIVPEYKTGLPAKYQDSSYTAPLYRMLGQKLNVSPAKLQSVVEGYGTGISKIAEMSIRGLIPDKYVTAKNKQGADINKTPIIRRLLGGEKRTEEEQTQSNISRAKSIDFQINDVKSAVKRGDMPQDEGIKEIVQNGSAITGTTGGIEKLFVIGNLTKKHGKLIGFSPQFLNHNDIRLLIINKFYKFNFSRTKTVDVPGN